MLNDYGFEGAQWDTAKEQARVILIECATDKRWISYTDLVGQISALSLEPYDVRLFHLLGEISSDEDKAGRGMLTAFVVHKTGDKQPGPGFYDLAKSLGKKVKDPVEFWVSEFNKVHDYWLKNNVRA